MLFHQIVVPLFLTILIEVLVVILMKRTSLKYFLAVVAVNMATNPALNFVLSVLSLYIKIQRISVVVILLEIVVVIVECLLLDYMMGEGKKKAMTLSAAMNISSYVVGLILLR